MVPIRVPTPTTTNTRSSIHFIEKPQKKPPFRGELTCPWPYGEDAGRLWITGSVSPHRFDVSNRRNGVATVTRVASNVFREPKALQPIDVDVDVLAGFRQRVEAPGSQSEVDAELQPGVLLAEFVVDLQVRLDVTRRLVKSLAALAIPDSLRRQRWVPASPGGQYADR